MNIKLQEVLTAPTNQTTQYLTKWLDSHPNISNIEMQTKSIRDDAYHVHLIIIYEVKEEQDG